MRASSALRASYAEIMSECAGGFLLTRRRNLLPFEKALDFRRQRDFGVFLKLTPASPHLGLLGFRHSPKEAGRGPQRPKALRSTTGFFHLASSRSVLR